ncbi:YtxH domain-containing protein [Clostridiaceae bacterium UIB06]|uniref:YtxH domain-containing protein n=1 Tax=Clostridium thailandense TaxID=2794346 RepID=A0A949TYK1_9CLOT|nr:YtxH domain-containing protein [Clostridium thailandense]MBV7274988.1 YtxH domain-containing protein [Clostridium thailandense]MCH5137907.1 YtxH domain-containing protein [Clostridiaceae bacterium UIB06]
MRGKFITGALLGAAVGMMMMPEMDRSTKRKIRRTAKVVRHAAGDMFEDIRDRVK